jgi:eukaryotic-like serine/threonine-protein kinase
MNKLGKYQIRRTLGKGAMGVVYEGFDPVIERRVAIKTILPSQLGGGESAALMARFKREAQAAGRLNHPGIVAIYEYGEDVAQDSGEDEATRMVAAPAPNAAAPAQRVAFIAMEFVDGRELRDCFERGQRFPLPEVARIMGETLDALDHAHAQGVVHRDIKPANLILLANGQVKIADFGIAHLEASELTQTGAVLGTPSYMSPEQFMGQPVDGRSDLFSCGVMLYQLLTGEKPFTGESTTTLMYKVLREDPVPPSELNLSLAPQLDAVVKKALAKAPAQRFQSGREFAEALRTAIAVQPGSLVGVASAGAALQQPTGIDASASASALAAHSAIPASAAPHTGRGAAAWWTAGAAASVAVLAGAYLLMAPGRPPAAPAAQAQDAAANPPVVATAPPAPVIAPAAAPVAEAGTMVISALGSVDLQDPRFNGNLASAQLEARGDAKRQLIEKAVALYVEPASLDGHRALIERRLLTHSGSFIRAVLQEGVAGDGQGGRVEMQTRAVVNMRDVQKSLNQLSREERVEFIRRKGDPRISIRIAIANAAGGNLARERSQLAENVVKDRIKSFGFRVWAAEGDAPAAANGQAADFAIDGEVKLKQLSTRLPASGLTITKTALTSWTLKAVEAATGEEVYLSTRLPTGQTWASEEQALADIGKLVGDEFSRDFFLQHFSFRTQKTGLTVTGLPAAAGAPMLRELRGMRAVLDAQPASEPGRFQLQLPEGIATDIVQDAIVRPLNAKLGLDCFALAGASGAEVTIAFAPGCATPEMRTKMEAGPPAGLRPLPGAGGKVPAKPVMPARNTA